MDTTIAIERPAPLPTTGSVHAVTLRDVTYGYGERRALDGLSLDVPAGTIFGLLGPNGAGKSTLLSLLIGRRRAQAGEVRVLGEPLTDGLRRRVGVVFQEPSLDPLMTVRDTMLLQAQLFNMPRADAAAATDRMLERVGLADRTGDRTAALSGGMKRRLELARALLTGPELILLDEPTLALDPDSRLAIWRYLLDEHAAGRTLVVATNDVAEAERYCTQVALLHDGRVVAEGAPAELKRALRHDAVRIEWKPGDRDGAKGIAVWPGVGGVAENGDVSLVTTDDASAFLARLFQESGAHVHAVRVEESTLEDVYFQLAGRGIAQPGGGT